MGELLATVDAWELACWRELAAVDPYGEDRADWRAAQVASTVANYAGKESTRVREPGDVLLKFEEKPREDLDVASKIRAGFARIMAAQNAGRK